VNLTDTLEALPYEVNLPDAIQQALGSRTELVALRNTEELQRLNIVNARSGYQPVVQLFAGYNWNSSSFNTDLSDELHGWNAGAQVQWNIFDGLLTHGKVIEATAAAARRSYENRLVRCITVPSTCEVKALECRNSAKVLNTLALPNNNLGFMAERKSNIVQSFPKTPFLEFTYRKRFREIERSIPGITTRMLSRELKELELNKIIKRTVYPDSPVLVEYESTEYCTTFGDIILEMIKWGIDHRKMIAKKY